MAPEFRRADLPVVPTQAHLDAHGNAYGADDALDEFHIFADEQIQRRELTRGNLFFEGGQRQRRHL